jgi:NAD(P)-dependent dehydrogenase (short-subunit alcohol dehydrogenase family)
MELSGKNAIITGGTGALGAVMSHALAKAGANVYIMARSEEKTKSLVRDIESAGGKAQALLCDVLDKNALAEAAQSLETVDILINGAGGNKPEATAMPNQRSFFDLPEEALSWVFELNLMGTLLPSQVFGAKMASQKSGIIVNISSMASMRPLTRVVAYAGAKAAINNFTQWLAVYMAQEFSPNIRVNAIAPGFFVGEQNRYLLFNQDGSLSQRGQQIINHTPMGRFGEAEDLIGTLLWLTSDASRFVTGIVIPVDGGFSAYSGV